MWFNCAALHGLRIPAARMFSLFCVAWVDWVDLKLSWFPLVWRIVDALFHVAGMGRERQFCTAGAAQT